MSELWLIFPISYYKLNCLKQNEFTEILRRKKLIQKAAWNSSSPREKKNKMEPTMRLTLEHCIMIERDTRIVFL